jgi:hypothetical protein
VRGGSEGARERGSEGGRGARPLRGGGEEGGGGSGARCRGCLVPRSDPHSALVAGKPRHNSAHACVERDMGGSRARECPGVEVSKRPQAHRLCQRAHLPFHFGGGGGGIAISKSTQFAC